MAKRILRGCTPHIQPAGPAQGRSKDRSEPEESCRGPPLSACPERALFALTHWRKGRPRALARCSILIVTYRKEILAMLKHYLRVSSSVVALTAALTYWSGVASADPFVHVSGTGVSGQAKLDVTGLQVTNGSTVITPTAYNTVESDASTTINGTDPSLSQKTTGPSFGATTSSALFNNVGGQTFATASNPTAGNFSSISEAMTTAPPVVANGANTQSFFFTAATAGAYNIQYAMAGHVQVDGTTNPAPGTTAAAAYAFSVDITTQIGSATPTTTHVGLEQDGVSVPLFGRIFSSQDGMSKSFGTQYTINAVEGERIQLLFYENTGVTASFGTPAVPEPSTLMLACIGVVGVGFNRLRRRAPVLAV